jgi:hypothetical protein
MGKPEGTRKLGRLKCGGQISVKADLKKNKGKTVCFVDLAWHRGK